MSVSINIHPGEKWKKIEASLHGKHHGDCIHLWLDQNSFSFHYGKESDKNDFILKLKKAINGLPEE